MLKNNKGIIQKIRQSRTFKGTCMLVLLSLLFELAQPTVSLALTEGPSQPEVQSFEPINTTQMVDLFSGDFNYNIPLFNLPGPNGGYPFNLAYHAGVSADDEASWVGLGWNINAGSLVRNMRGLPDEFFSSSDSDGNWTSGDFIETKTDIKESWTMGISFNKSTEIVGGNITNAGLSASLYFNNFRGLGVSVGPQFQVNNKYSLGLSLDGENGLGVSPSVSGKSKEYQRSHSLGFTFDGDLSLSYSIANSIDMDKIETSKQGYTMTDYDQNASSNFGAASSFARSNFSPSIGQKKTSYSLGFNFTKGAVNLAIYSGKGMGGFFQIEDFDDEEKSGKKRPVMGYARSKNATNNEFFTKDFTRMNDGQITKQSVILPNSYYTYDSYSSTGQGLIGYFRGKRNDVGRVHDPKKRNTSWGASLDVEIKKVTTTTTSVTVASVLYLEPLAPNINIPGSSTVSSISSNHLGIGGAATFGWDKQGAWDSDANDSENDLNQLDFDFAEPWTVGIAENHFYQAHGEQTILNENEYNHINGLELALVKFATKDADNLAGGKRRIKASDNTHINNDRDVAAGDRVVRNTLVHNLMNEEVEKLGEYTIRHYVFSSQLDLTTNPSVLLNRTTRSGNSIKQHYAGFKVLNEQGSNYVYGLPAYNTKEVENVFSVGNTQSYPNENTDVMPIDVVDGEVDYHQANTHKYINKTTKSPYAHSYMLSSIQGADYVDVSNDGPTNDDLGYWVKFDYVQYANDQDPYKWRAPYAGAQYNRGDRYTRKDDKASYQYGEKEIWYLGRAETKTHIAVFVMEERDDSKAAEGEFSNVNSTSTNDNKSGLKLMRIELYEKDKFGLPDVKPIQVVHFEYTSQLCPGSPNSDEAQDGKLTLSKVWFTSYKSQRKRNEYSFDYTTVNVDPALQSMADASVNGSGVLNNDNNLVNPRYKNNAMDPWGTYKHSTDDFADRMQFPYTNQFNQGTGFPWSNLYQGNQESEYNKKVTQTAQDLASSAWCLKKINLPSGGAITVDYESDDYGYVQHKTANQMFKITKLGDGLGLPGNTLYAPDGGAGYNYEQNPASRRVYFKLEHPIPVSQTGNLSKYVYDHYVDPIITDESGNKNLYLKAFVNLITTPSEVKDFVSGYLPIEDYFNTDLFGADEQASIDIEGDNTSSPVACYTRGYLTLKTAKRKDGTAFSHYHPISLMAWNYMQTQAQELMNNPNSFDSEDDQNVTLGEILGKIVDLINFVPAAAVSFGLVRKYCQQKGFASSLDLSRSCMRLASPDKKKLGGGHRVKQISITDNWSASTNEQEETHTYGQRFEYTIEENGTTISSGVAQYEPQAGGDENPLKYPIYFYGKSSVFTNNNLFAEAPMNEDLFPGAMVGYRRVTVKSINTGEQLRNAGTAAAVGRTGGVTVNDFYTAKEFPTLVEYSVLAEENSTKDVFNLTIPIPLIGTIKRNYYHGTQAFKIELNDMHGKPKGVKSYELNGYVVNSNPISSSEYEYQTKPISYQGEQVLKLDNYVRVIRNDGTHNYNDNEQRLMGVEAELFTDQRETKSFTNTIGLEFNADLPFPSLPIPSFWPSYSNFKTMSRTYVTNKVVHRTGILKKTKTRDLQAVNESEIIAYDERSGIPLLTRIKNEFGDNFYNYNVPAYYAYEGMGHAYRNINYNFCTLVFHPDHDLRFENLEFDATSENLNYLVRGDELLISDANNTSNNHKKAYFLGWRYSSSGTRGMLHVPSQFSAPTEGQDVCLKVIRSGRRNQFSTPIANYLTKGKLTENYTDYTLDNSNGVDVITKLIPDNVLSASASLFNDNWSSSIYTTNSLTNIITENPYLSGNSGIWRPLKSYSYVGSRKTSASISNNVDTDPKLYDDGVMSNVPMFSWELGNIENYVQNWEWVSEVTRYSPDAYELENKNRLGIYSSALYGYGNSLSIGVGGNADYNEIGTSDFETIADDGFTKSVYQTNLNFDINHGSGNTYITELYDIVSASTSSASNLVSIKVAIPYSYFSNLSNAQLLKVGVTLFNRKSSNGLIANTGYYFNGELTNAADDGTGQATTFTLKPYLLDNSVAQPRLLPDDGLFYGKICFPIQRAFIAQTTSATYEVTKAHTGKNSLKLTSTATFDQPKLKFKADKKYILSLWVSRDATSVVTYKPSSGELVEIGKMSGATFQTITPDKITYSKIIEGWQKIDLEFEWDGQNINAIPAVRFTPGSALYVDDLRISPKTGGFVSHVYDSVRFWLTASLNVDNYATLFYYDEEGNLHLKKQETEEGIFTITESRGYVQGN